jgi:uncharacterized protein YkwD
LGNTQGGLSVNLHDTSRALLATLALAAAAGVPAADAGKPLNPGPGAAIYGSSKQLACKGSAFDALDYDLKRAVKKDADRDLQADGRLCAIAGAVLSWNPADGDSPPAHVVSFLSGHFGLARPVRRVFVLDLSLNLVASEGRSLAQVEAKAIDQSLQESVAKMLAPFDQPRWGMAATHVGKNVTRVALVIDDRALELDDVPRRLDAGKQAVLSGRVLPPLKDPTVTVSDPKGQVTKLEAAPGDAFKGELSCGSSPGDLWVDVQAQKDGKPVKVATFPVACGKDLPTTVALSAEAWPSDPRAQEKRLVDGVNAQREAGGLPRLEWDEALAGVAREVAAQLRDQLARGEAPGVKLEPILEKAGVASVVVLMNPAQAPTAAEVEGQLAANATSRQNMLSPEVNRVGVGVVPATAGGKPAVFVVELFTKFLEKVDPKLVQDGLYAEVARRRAAAGAAALERDPKLEKVAQDYALALAEGGGTIKPDDADDITHGIKIAYKAIDLVSGAKANPLDFAEPGAAASGSGLGIGVAQGDSPVLGKNAVYVVVLSATARVPEAPKPAAPAPKPAPPAPAPKPKPEPKKK